MSRRCLFFIMFLLINIILIETPRAEGNLRLLTYNVWGLPVPIKLNHKNLPKIKTELVNVGAHIVALQETFTKRADLFASMKEYPYKVYGNPKGKGKIISSGLLTLSRYPILRVERLKYSRCAGFDCFAAKGVLLTTIDVPGLGPLDVYNTHLNAGKSSRVKWSQLGQLVHFINTHSTQNPAVIMGDFNLEPDSDYFDFLTVQNQFYDTHKDYVSKHPELSFREKMGYTIEVKIPVINKWIKRKLDHIFLYEGTDRHWAKVENSKVLFNGTNGKKLSDHAAMMVDFQY